MQAKETKKNFQLIIDRLDETQGVIEVRSYDILNETDKLARMMKDATGVLNKINEDSSKEDINKALTLMKNYVPIFLDCVYAANDAAHDLEETAENQKETIDNIQYVLDFLFSID